MTDFQFFAILFSRMGLPEAQHCNGWFVFPRVKFHEWSASANFAEFTYLKKTNYTVYEPGFNTDKYGIFTGKLSRYSENREKRESLAQRIFRRLRSCDIDLVLVAE